MITLADVSAFASDKKQFRLTMVRNQFYMPHEKSKAVTLAWMYQVYR